jgi:hypothetical protein
LPSPAGRRAQWLLHVAGGVPMAGHDGVMDAPEPLRIANCSGFYGDRLSAAREMVDGGPIDVLTGDWLAELTMLLLARQRQRNPEAGYARTFVTQMTDVLGDCVDRGIRVVSNAGGQNPTGCADALRTLCADAGIDATVAVVEGDDLIGRWDDICGRHRAVNADTGEDLAALGADVVTANAYLGAWGVVEALAAGADVVVTGRIADAALVVGPAAWHFGWSRTDWDELAGAVVAGHVIECGTQCTGGNYAFFDEVPGLEHPGFPITEVHADGSSVITKHPGSGGLVSVGTVTAQLLYEVGGPRYPTPDVVARLDTVQLDPDGPDRVRVSGVRGLPAPDRVKVAVNVEWGWRNAMTFVLTGLDVEAKADLVERTLWAAIEGGRHGVAHAHTDLLRLDRADPAANTDAVALLRVTVADPDRQRVGRTFSDTVMGMLLASYPGMFTTTPPTDASPVGVYWPVLLPWSEVRCGAVVGGNGRGAPPTTIDVPPPPETAPLPTDTPTATPPAARRDWASEPTVAVPLGRVAGARSGDKGGNANVGVWATNPDAHDWLSWFLTAGRVHELLGPEATDLVVERYDLPNLAALNFVVRGLLGRGVAATTRFDPQAKGLGEFLRARVVPVPERLVS